jgi:hypothetical protein
MGKKFHDISRSSSTHAIKCKYCFKYVDGGCSAKNLNKIKANKKRSCSKYVGDMEKIKNILKKRLTKEDFQPYYRGGSKTSL